ncbi:MAG: bifunctional folylpolyglutamate synthase/dihydrofolate synthase, partial [Gemmatimonadaceae bacterium]
MDVDLIRYQDALQYLFARTTGGYKFGLERTETLLEALGNPHRVFPVLHVAGTNGKGSAVATAEALLRGRGLRVGKYTSPHLVDFRERIMVDDVAIPGQDVVSFVERWTPLVERVGA